MLESSRNARWRKHMRNISFAETKAQFRARTKRVTRRMRWIHVRAGDHLMGVEKSQGLKKGEKIVRLGPIVVEGVRRESLDCITQEDVIAEGFPDWTPAQFIAFFCKFNGCTPETIVTRIAFDYLDEATP
jgi:hypothetical protein